VENGDWDKGRAVNGGKRNKRNGETETGGETETKRGKRGHGKWGQKRGQTETGTGTVFSDILCCNLVSCRTARLSYRRSQLVLVDHLLHPARVPIRRASIH